MVDLTPHNPYGLALRSPVIVGPGCAEAEGVRYLDPALIGAIVTRTAVLHTPTGGPRRWAAVPAGVLFERLPVVRFRALVQAEAKRWRRATLPVLISLRGSPDELAEMVAQLEAIEGVAGLIIEAGEPGIEAARSQTPLPLLAVLPHDSAIEHDAPEIVAAGADALVVGAYPMGAAMAAGEPFEGLIVGPTLAPRTLHALRLAAGVVEVHLIAFGGVADAAIACQCIAAGATAVMIDGALYGDPHAPQRIAAELQRSAASDAAIA